MSSSTRVVRSSCRGCHGVCQVLVHMDGEKVVRISGDPDSPTSRGFLCPKGAAVPEMLYHPDRLTHPPEMHQIRSLRTRHPDPVVEIHPEAAARLGISDGDRVRLESPYGQARLKARLFDGLAPDVVNAEHAWWYPEAPPPDYRWKESCANLLYGDDHFDPDTGAEPLKCYICRVSKA